MGYAYSVRFRIAYDSGPDTNYDLSQLTEGKGPISTVVDYDFEKTSRLTPNRKIRESYFGARPIVAMRFEIATLTDEAWLADIVSACNRSDARVYLSLDAGTTEREVKLDSKYTRAPLAGKATAGIEVDLVFKAVELIAEVPAIGAGAW